MGRWDGSVPFMGLRGRPGVGACRFYGRSCAVPGETPPGGPSPGRRRAFVDAKGPRHGDERAPTDGRILSRIATMKRSRSSAESFESAFVRTARVGIRSRTGAGETGTSASTLRDALRAKFTQQRGLAGAARDGRRAAGGRLARGHARRERARRGADAPARGAGGGGGDKSSRSFDELMGVLAQWGRELSGCGARSSNAEEKVFDGFGAAACRSSLGAASLVRNRARSRCAA